MKKKKITYNAKGLKRKDSVSPPKNIPIQDININEIVIDTNTDHYWRIIKIQDTEEKEPISKEN